MLQPYEMHAGVLLLAVAIDVVFGEFPAAIHPVVWIGRLISRLEKIAPNKGRKAYGVFILLICTLLPVIVASLLMYVSFLISPLLFMLVSAFFLKSTFSIGGLISTATDIQEHLENDDVDLAKETLPALVGRDPSNLSEQEISSAAIESLAENYVDTILSPLLFFLILGVPGAILYKTVNTLDSMIGYKDEEYRELGWASARADDILNYIPARLSPLFLLPASFMAGGSFREGVRTWKQDRRETSSPNSGWSMSILSGALQRKLSKTGHYTLGEDYPPPEPVHINKAANIIWAATAIMLLVFIFTIFP